MFAYKIVLVTTSAALPDQSGSQESQESQVSQVQEISPYISFIQMFEGPCGRRLVLVPHREDDPG